MLINQLPLIMIRCLLMTVLIECGLAFLIGIRSKRDLLFVVLVNVITNPIVVISTFLVNVIWNSTVSTVYEYIVEAIAWIVEGIIYSKTLSFKKIRPVIISMILNLTSYLIGEVFNIIFY